VLLVAINDVRLLKKSYKLNLKVGKVGKVGKDGKNGKNGKQKCVFVLGRKRL